MDEALDIGEVAQRTGLTARGLRFYEARGLVRPLRTASGRRIYGAGELARLNAVVALKRAGFPLSQIASLLGDRRVDLGHLVTAQIEALDGRALELARARERLRKVQCRIDRGEPIDVVTLCSLIAAEDDMTERERWKRVLDRYYSPEQGQEWEELATKLPEDFREDGYLERWRELSGRIEAVLPLDPKSQEAQAFVDEWFALLKPFSDVATREMWDGAANMYGRMDEWEGEADPGFSRRVYAFISDATRARIEAGGTVEAPAWVTGGRG
jgi:MerR family transcriptional regulator, thiopeptide resistance regulator